MMTGAQAGQLVRPCGELEWLGENTVGEVLAVSEQGLLVSWRWGKTRLVIGLDAELVELAFPPGWDPENRS
jgi:hypothetical protein